MSSLSEFSKKFQPRKKIEEVKKEIPEETKVKIDQQILEQYQKLSGKSQGELMSELIKEANRLKSQGNFNVGIIEQAIDNMGDALDEQKKQTMKQILNKMK